MGILKGPTGLPSLGLPTAPKRNPRVELPEWKVKISRGWGTSGPAVRGPRDQIDSCLPGTSCELEHWLRRLSALAQGGGGAKCGGGGTATSTSVAFIHLAAPIRAPVTHPQPHRCLPRGLRVSRPCSQLGAGCSGTPLRRHPGRRSPSIQPLELGGGTEGASDPG